ncbi:hypothetical protein ACP70R_029956 [Stipagrostis hirtigluma subsp. patula]
MRGVWKAYFSYRTRTPAPCSIVRRHQRATIDEAEGRGAHAAGDNGLAMAAAAGRAARVSILARDAVRLEPARAAVRDSTEKDVRDAAAVARARALQEAGPVGVLVFNLVLVLQELEKQDMEEVK